MQKQKEAKQQATDFLKLHQQVLDNIQKANAKYKQRADKGLMQREQFNIGDFVWVHLRKERFPKQRKSKLMPRAIGPYQIINKYGENAYKVDLPEEYGVSTTFNIGDCAPYHATLELRTILSQEEENAPNSELDSFDLIAAPNQEKLKEEDCEDICESKNDLTTCANKEEANKSQENQGTAAPTHRHRTRLARTKGLSAELVRPPEPRPVQARVILLK